MAGWPHDSMDMNLGKIRDTVREGHGNLVCRSPQGSEEWDMIWGLNNNRMERAETLGGCGDVKAQQIHKQF